MSGKAILVVGARGTGKTTTNKTWAKKVHPDRLLIFDYQGEYKDIYPKPFIGFQAFSKMITTVRGMFIVIEEATVFLENRGYNGDIVDTLVSARHADNTLLFSFHSFRAVPKYIFSLCNMVIVHKTGDSPEYVEKTFENPDLLAAFNEIKNAPNLRNTATGKEYSPNKIVKLY
jgi:hypothetical protein